MQKQNIKAIIVAGGVGKRMGKTIPKQFLIINQKPIIIHTLHRFLEVLLPHRIVVSIKEEQKDKLLSLFQDFGISSVHIVNGGETRTDSVRNGLMAIYNTEPNFRGFVLIHDAVRPFVSKMFLEQFIKELTVKNSLITVCPIKNSLRRITNKGTEVVNREEFLEVQTPQGFLFQEIYEAYLRTNSKFTDDASLYEFYYQKSVHTIEYLPENIKITTLVDLVLADYLSKNGF